MSEATRRWPAMSLSKSAGQPLLGNICATVWPTRALDAGERWFDEIHCWTEGFDASTTQRAGIQLMSLKNAFLMLENELADHVGVTLSFGTVERRQDELLALLQAHSLVTQRLVVILRGAVARMRAPARVRAFIDHLRAHQIPVGYRACMPRVTMELREIDFVRPDFGKLFAPRSDRTEFWQDFILEARVAGVPRERMIVAGLDSQLKVELAKQAGVRFGQGNSVRPAYAPQELPDAK